MNINKNILIIAIAIVLLAILITGGYLFYLKSKTSAVSPAVPTNNSKTEDLIKTNIAEDSAKITEDATKGVLPQIQTNPLDQKPDLNPVSKTNPYKNIKTNPFK